MCREFFTCRSLWLGAHTRCSLYHGEPLLEGTAGCDLGETTAAVEATHFVVVCIPRHGGIPGRTIAVEATHFFLVCIPHHAGKNWETEDVVESYYTCRAVVRYG